MESRSYNIQMVLFANNVHDQAAWWAKALGWVVEYPSEEFLQRLEAAGHIVNGEGLVEFEGRRVFRTASAIHQEVDGVKTGARIYIKGVKSPKTERNRLHWDIEARPEPVDDVVARLLAIGATQIGEDFQGPNRSVQMLDPENNEFCVH
ncbi:MAG: VOC family protein [Micrococcales bacterium]